MRSLLQWGRPLRRTFTWVWCGIRLSWAYIPHYSHNNQHTCIVGLAPSLSFPSSGSLTERVRPYIPLIIFAALSTVMCNTLQFILWSYSCLQSRYIYLVHVCLYKSQYCCWLCQTVTGLISSPCRVCRADLDNHCQDGVSMLSFFKTCWFLHHPLVFLHLHIQWGCQLHTMNSSLCEGLAWTWQHTHCMKKYLILEAYLCSDGFLFLILTVADMTLGKHCHTLTIHC